MSKSSMGNELMFVHNRDAAKVINLKLYTNLFYSFLTETCNFFNLSCNLCELGIGQEHCLACMLSL